MKGCNNCLWEDICVDKGEKCEYYQWYKNDESIALREYNRYLEERVNDYQDIIKDFDN